ncbi:MAG: hypothetical protein ACOCXH_16525, partial [Cyclobacteriaceae bacterium]
MKQLFVLLTLLGLSAQISFAQFKLDAQICPLAEYRRGYERMPFPEDKASAFIVQRTRLNLQHTHQ